MEKRIFSEEEQTQAAFQPKQEFVDAEVVLETEMPETAAEQALVQELKPSRFWVRLLLVALAVLGLATIAQSVQWLLDTWQNNQWIYFAFALGFFGISLAGIGAILNEWRKLVWLRKHYRQQQTTQQWLLEDHNGSGEEAVKLCNQWLNHLQTTPAVSKARWQKQLDEAYNAKEVLYLFSETVLRPIDNQIKQQISKSAAENALIVAVSPLALVDILMVAWRNIGLVNKITRAYGMELGYVSRLRLFRMVLTNMVFAGATEIVSDMGMDFFSQNLTAKLSMRAAQGIGVGLLTARLGIKAMEFCRPIAFQANERPKLSVVRQELLGTLKQVFFTQEKNNEKEKNYVK